MDCNKFVDFTARFIVIILQFFFFVNQRMLLRTFRRTFSTQSGINLSTLGRLFQYNKSWLLIGLTGTASYCTMNQIFKEARAEEKSLPMNPKEFLEFPLKEKIPVTHNTAVYRFLLPSPEQKLDLPVASFILAAAEIPGEEKAVVRPYTPITYDEQGYFDLMIKSYPTGKLSKSFGELKPGDKMKFKGPNGKITYKANMKKEIGMIAGGTGITPMLQILHEITKNPDDHTAVTVIFGNQSSNDILLKDNLDEITKKNKNVKVHFIIDKPEEKWQGQVGYITDDYAKKLLPPPSKDTLIFVCGPPPMMEAISGSKTPKFEQGELKGVLKRLGYNEDQVYKF